MTLFLSLFMACKDQATIDENNTLKTRVADLERTKERLEKDNEALKIQLDKAKAAPATPAGGETPAAPAADLPGKVTFKTTLGDIHCTLRTTQTPETIANFVGLATGKKEWTDPRTNQKSSAPLYDGTIFHRVIPGFMAQGGDPLGNGTGGPGYTFADEVGDFTKFDKPGLLAMANRGPNTNGSQFFITDGTPTHLNRKHTIFGDCKDLDVVKKITNAKTGDRDKPETDIVLQKVILGS